MPLDNNAAERALRGPVGRKNHYVSRSMRGTQVDALYAAIATPGAITQPEDLLTPQSV